MSQIYNIYCDESCHLENDGQKVMTLGALWCPKDRRHEIAEKIRAIKTDHGLSRSFEIKWTKVPKGRQDFYTKLLEYFFVETDLHLRTLVVPDKTLLRHEEYQQDHDTWYYKMYFDLLKIILEPDALYQIFLDRKDSRSLAKNHKLHDVLCNAHFDFDKRIIRTVQTVQSHEVEQIQLVDFLIGIITYANRELTKNATKVSLIKKMRELSRYTLTQSTLPAEKKVNIFIWQASYGKKEA